MTSQCIHGFRTDECASCRTCPHGLVRARCSRCEAASSAASRARLKVAESHPSQAYGDFEIYFDPTVSGWYYRNGDAERSDQSYRSAFLARKAVDGLGNGVKGARSAKRSS